MPTPMLSILLFLVAAVLGALGQFLYKEGAAAAGRLGYFNNPRLLFGVLCYVGVMVLFVAAFRKGGSLTVLYPIYASTFIFGAIIAYFAYDTPIKAANVCGMVLLVAGMYLMGK